MSALAVVVAAVLSFTGHLPWPGGTVPSPAVAAPWEYTVPAWEEALGGDVALSAARYRELARFADPQLSQRDRGRLARLAADLVRADLTGDGRERFGGYWPPAAATGVPATGRCEAVDVLAVSAAALPTVDRPEGVRGYAKILVAYTGRCGDLNHTIRSPGVLFVYASQSRQGRWRPVRSWDVPAPAAPVDNPQAATEPAAWELKEFGGCASAGTVFRARIVVVDAFEAMCAQALADGVTMTVESAYRTRAEQAVLFEAAVGSYGSEQEARKWVAYADDAVCTSRHCSGVAVNVRPTSKTIGWLTAVVGCADGAGVRPATECPDWTTPVPRMARYGFAAPLAAIPGYLEFTLPVDTSDGPGSLSAPDCHPAGVPVPNMVASIFRCRLAQEGVVGPEQEQVVAQALVVSRCESGWNAAARAYAGRFTTVPHPVDGRRYTHTGVFMLTHAIARGWVDGGVEALTDPVANINGAASLWLATRGWEQFGCATGTDGGFESGPVLPEHGGPAVPGWARLY